ncbi:hypothetical protein ACVMBY_003424 [Bradyrhizobium huanghuaihaiense]
MCPLALTTKPVPLFDLAGLLAGGDACLSAVAAGFAVPLVKSPALLSPSAFTRVTQFASAAIMGAVDVNTNWSGLLPLVVTTIRLAFWKVRAKLRGRMVVTMLGAPAVANNLACSWPSKMKSTGAVSPLLKRKLGLAKLSSQEPAAFCATTRLTPLA